jgi:voltage-gated potassium channel Kch
MAKQFTLAERLRYRFDDYMSRGTVALIGGLAALSLVVVMLAGLVLAVAGITPDGGERLGFLEAVWASLMRTLDAGTMGGDTGWGFRLVMLGVTFGGIFVISTLIGVLNNGIEAKLDELRKGRSVVVENGHTVILGWSPQVFAIVSELALANANQRRSAVAILAEKDKVEMEDEIRDRVGAAAGRTRVICRTGNPIEMSDLEIVNPHGARSIIILAPEGGEPDSRTIKTILALTNNPDRRREPYHIVAEIRDPKNLEVARMVGRDEVELLLVGELISRIAAQTCRQSGLSVVYTELLDFGGDEIYFQEEPRLAGQTFGEALLAYETSAVIGLRLPGGVQLKPPMGTRLQAGDQVIAISQDDDTVRLSGRADLGIDADAIRSAAPRQARPERTLILGWNRQAPTIINELDSYVAPGSQVLVAADDPDGKAAIARECGGVRNQSVAFYEADTTDRRTLDSLGVQDYDHVITLSYRDTLDPQEADARTLVTLLHLRDIAGKAGQRFSIVSEMLDIRNRQLAEVTRADDFIVSDRLISLMLSQISENKELAPVFADLFDPEGAELYLKPAGDYVQLGRPVNFYTVVEAARRRGEVAIGYRLQAQAGSAADSYGVKVNPDKAEKVAFAETDRVIVLADE